MDDITELISAKKTGRGRAPNRHVCAAEATAGSGDLLPSPTLACLSVRTSAAEQAAFSILTRLQCPLATGCTGQTATAGGPAAPINTVLDLITRIQSTRLSAKMLCDDDNEYASEKACALTSRCNGKGTDAIPAVYTLTLSHGGGGGGGGGGGARFIAGERVALLLSLVYLVVSAEASGSVDIVSKAVALITGLLP
jgi:hypothetical protein